MSLHAVSQSIDTAVTLEPEVSPRKLDLVGVTDLPEVFASVGKVNRETGEPLSVPRLSNLSKNDPKFPKPWIEKPLRRYWRRAAVLDYARGWDQKDGPRPKPVVEKEGG